MTNHTQLVDQARQDLQIVTDHADRGLPWCDTIAGHARSCWRVVKSRKVMKAERKVLFTALHHYYLAEYPMQKLADDTGISIATFSNQFQALNLDRHLPTRRTAQAGPPARTYKVNVAAFDDPADEETAYWLGFLWADGSLIRPSRGYEGVKLRLKHADRAHVELFKAFLGSSHLIVEDLSAELTNGKRYKGAEIRIYSVELARRLASLGFGQRRGGAANMAPPLGIRQNERAFWRGMVDGDGSIRRDADVHFALSGWKLELASTQATAELFRDYISRHFEGRSDIRPNGRSKTNYRISVFGPLAVELITHLYPPGCIALARKRRRAEWIAKGAAIAAKVGVKAAWVGAKRMWVGPKSAKTLIERSMSD